MIFFFRKGSSIVYTVGSNMPLKSTDLEKLTWLFGNAEYSQHDTVEGLYIGPRKEMVTPWSTNAVEITQNMGISGIDRIEEFHLAETKHAYFDPMLQFLYKGLDQHIFTVVREPEPIQYVEDLSAYNQSQGLALSDEEIDYLKKVSHKIGRMLTDSEVYGFAQVN